MNWWWWWIAFVVWLTNGKCLVLFPVLFPSQISDMPQAGFEPAQKLSSGLIEWSCALAINTTPQCHQSQYVWAPHNLKTHLPKIFKMHLQFSSFNISFSLLLPNTNVKIDITITGNHTLQKTWMGFDGTELSGIL